MASKKRNAHLVQSVQTEIFMAKNLNWDTNWDMNWEINRDTRWDIKWETIWGTKWDTNRGTNRCIIRGTERCQNSAQSGVHLNDFKNATSFLNTLPL